MNNSNTVGLKEGGCARVRDIEDLLPRIAKYLMDNGVRRGEYGRISHKIWVYVGVVGGDIFYSDSRSSYEGKCLERDEIVAIIEKKTEPTKEIEALFREGDYTGSRSNLDIFGKISQHLLDSGVERGELGQYDPESFKFVGNRDGRIHFSDTYLVFNGRMIHNEELREFFGQENQDNEVKTVKEGDMLFKEGDYTNCDESLDVFVKLSRYLMKNGVDRGELGHYSPETFNFVGVVNGAIFFSDTDYSFGGELILRDDIDAALDEESSTHDHEGMHISLDEDGDLHDDFCTYLLREGVVRGEYGEEYVSDWYFVGVRNNKIYYADDSDDFGSIKTVTKRGEIENILYPEKANQGIDEFSDGYYMVSNEDSELADKFCELLISKMYPS